MDEIEYKHNDHIIMMWQFVYEAMVDTSWLKLTP